LRPVKVSFHLPIKDNPDENNYRRPLLKEINDVLKQIILRWPAWSFEGYYAKGKYRMPDGSEAVDIHRRYFVVMEEREIGDLEQILLTYYKNKTTQESIYLEIQYDVEVRLLK
jgi:hypothetical protein